MTAIDAMFKVNGVLCASVIGGAGFEWSNGNLGVAIPISGCKFGEV